VAAATEAANSTEAAAAGTPNESEES
jgi:hypothetical protein